MAPPDWPAGASDAAVATPPPAGLRFGRFELRGQLGAGAIGTVHRAFDPERGLEVALKVLSLPLAALAEDDRRLLLERFRREARLAASVRHPGIARVLDAGEEQGVPWIAIELVRGETLATLAARRRGDATWLRDAVRLAAEAADAIEEAHRRGVLHRDLKPANILVEEASGAARVTDFGLARELAPGSRLALTNEGQALGTPQYMAPEQARGELDALDARTDVYGLGATLYHALCGRPPFDGDAPWRVALAVIRDELVPPRAVDPTIPPALDAIVRCALSRERERRYASAGELAAELRAWLSGAEARVRGRPKAPPGPRLWPVVRASVVRHKAVAVTIAAALVVIIGGTVTFLMKLATARDRAEQRAGIARHALERLVNDVREQLGDVPGERVRGLRRRLLELAAKDLDELRKVEAESAPYTVAAAEAQRQIGDLALDAGNTAVALDAYKKSLEIAQELAARAPADPQARQTLALAWSRIARGLNEKGDTTGCLAAFESALASARALMAATPADPKAKALVSSVLDNIGHVRRDAGDVPGAAAAFEESVAIGREIVRGAPKDAEARRGLAMSLTSLGEIRRDGGDLAGAAAAHEESLVTFRAILAALPESAAARRDV